MADDQSAYFGQNTESTTTSETNTRFFAAKQLMNIMSTATLVQVKSITNKGEVKEAGTMSVLPLVNMLDGRGTAFKHGPVNNIIYLRMQGGNKAIILDPKPGDIGLVVFADRDISSVKKSKKQSNPGSGRRYDMADGVYIMTVLAAKPDCYLRFTDDSQIIASPDDKNTFLTLTKDKVTIQIGRSKIEMTDSTMKFTSPDIDHIEG